MISNIIEGMAAERARLIHFIQTGQYIPGLEAHHTGIFEDIGDAFTSVGNTIADGVVDAANTVKDGVVDAANTVKDGVLTAAYAEKDFAVDKIYPFITGPLKISH